MERGQLLYGLLGLGIGLTLGWLFWRFRSVSRDAAVALQARVDTAERRLSRSEDSRGENEKRIAELEQSLAGERQILDDVLAATGKPPVEPLFGATSEPPSSTAESPQRESTETVEAAAPLAAASPNGPDVAGLGHLATDQERVDTLAERLGLSQSWLEESETRVAELEEQLTLAGTNETDNREQFERVESRLALTKEALVAADARVQALTGELADRDAAIAGTRQSIQLIKQQATEAGNSLEGVIDLRQANAGPEASLSTNQLLSLRQAEVTALRRKVDTIESDVDQKSAALEQRQAELVAQLEQAQTELEAVGDAPERAALLHDEVARLRALVADHSIESDRLSSQLAQRDEIDNKLDGLFVEIHELRGRSATLRSGIRKSPPASDGNH